MTGLSLTLTAPIWGSLADRFGRKLMLMRSLWGGALLVAAMAFATEPAHLLAIRAAGVTARIAHQIKRPTEGKLFGWEDQPAVSDDDRDAWDRAEALTDDLLEPAYAVLDEPSRVAFLAGLDRIQAALAG